MTVEQKARQLALTLVGEDQSPEPLIEVLMDMAEWQREQLFKLKEGVKPWSEEYEDNFEDEFAKTLAEKKEILPRGEERFSDMDMYRVALHFSGWQKQQIMKDVVEATIIKTRVTNQTMAPTLSSVILSDAFHEGDKDIYFYKSVTWPKDGMNKIEDV